MQAKEREESNFSAEDMLNNIKQNSKENRAASYRKENMCDACQPWETEK